MKQKLHNWEKKISNKKKIKELEDEIDSLTEANDDLNNLIDGFFDNEPNKNDSIIYDIFCVYAEKSSNYSDDLIKICTKLLVIFNYQRKKSNFTIF